MRDLQNWLKRIRKAVFPQKLRFYGVGEYGSESQRPHYHVALFGYQGCYYPFQSKFERAHCKCRQCSLVRETWGKGRTDCAYLEEHSAQYISGYVMKRRRDPDDEWLNGRIPEFARMSLRPGIGADFMKGVADSAYGLLTDGDVPDSLFHGKKKYQLGRYLRGLLREEYGFSERKAPYESLERFAQSMSELYEEAEKSDAKKEISPRQVLKRFIIDSSEQVILNMETKSKMLKGDVL